MFITLPNWGSNAPVGDLDVKHLTPTLDFSQNCAIIDLSERDRKEEITMTNEVIKAMQSKKEHKIRKWWYKNGHKVWRVILFPLWIGSILTYKCRVWLNNRQEWSEERATEILNYYIPAGLNGTPKIKVFTSLIMAWVGIIALRSVISREKTAVSGKSIALGGVEKCEASS